MTRIEWTDEEIAILSSTINEHPEKGGFAICQIIKHFFPNRNQGSIVSKVDRLKRNKLKKSIPQKSIVDRIFSIMQKLEELQDEFEDVWEDVAVLERWAEQTLLVKSKLKYNVDQNGTVNRVETKKE